MTSCTLNRDSAAKLSANHYIATSPNHLLKGIDYVTTANNVLNRSPSKIEQDIMIYAGLEWGLYKTDDLEEHLQLKMREWLATP
ncbi:MAG: hypothetical protein CTY19_12865 [Methylomonas sp.]|nr:MAG: hypothetical protein CTY19_12865 [Methylomonas sp.]